jgi:hypothetical protein
MSRSGSGTGNGFRTTFSSTLKMALDPPMPKASARTAAALNAGVRDRDRKA